MGLLSGIATLLNMDTERKEAIRKEIDLANAVEAHIHWKLRLQDYLDGRSAENLDPMVVCRDDQCELGRWIHGPAVKHFHDMEAFHELRADHAQFHYVAANVVKGMQENDRIAAEALLKGDYARISNKVVLALKELNRAVQQ